MGVVAQLEDVEERLYSEELYERTHAVRDLCVLFSGSKGFSSLLQRPALFSLLARLLREDGRKSLDLSLEALTVFSAISYFPELQNQLLEHQIGSRTVETLAFIVSTLQTEGQQSRESALSNANSKHVLHKHKQEQACLVCLRLLLNLADNSPTVSRKIVKKGIVPLLGACLSCRSLEVLLLAVRFLHNLSANEVAVAQLLECNTLQALSSLLQCPRPAVQAAVLSCLHSLALHAVALPAFTAAVLSEVIRCLETTSSHPEVMSAALQLSYTLSCSSECRPHFGQAPALPGLLAGLLLQSSKIAKDPEAAKGSQAACALLINVGHVAAAAQALTAEDVQGLAGCAIRSRDAVMLKAVRVLSQHQDSAHLAKFAPLAQDLLSLAQAEEPGSRLQLEAVGCLAHLCSAVDRAALLADGKAARWLQQLLLSQKTGQDDVALEALRLCQTLAGPSTAHLIAESGMVATLQRLLDSFARDEVLLSNVLWALSALLSSPGPDSVLLDNKQDVPSIKPKLDKLLKAECQHVRLAAAIALDLVARAAAVG